MSQQDLPGFDLTVEDVIVNFYGLRMDFAEKHFPGLIEYVRSAISGASSTRGA